MRGRMETDMILQMIEKRGHKWNQLLRFFFTFPLEPGVLAVVCTKKVATNGRRSCLL